METSIIIAQMLSVCYLSIGIGFLASRKFYAKDVLKTADKPFMVLISGYFSIIFGMSILYVIQSMPNSQWYTLFLILGWVACLKGILHIIFPGVMVRYSTMFQTKYYTSVGATIIVLGLVLGYLGFFM